MADANPYLSMVAATPVAGDNPYAAMIAKPTANPKAEAWRARNPNEPDANNPYLPGYGVPSLSHLWQDVKDRRRQAGEALDQAISNAAEDLNPLHQPASVEEAQRRAQSTQSGMLGFPQALQNVAGAALGLTPGVPELAALADTVAGRPVEAATGGAIPAQFTGNLVSAAVPIGGQAAAEAGLARAAAEAGMSVEGYQAMLAQQQATARAAAAATKAAKPPGPAAPFAAAVSPKAAEAQAAARIEQAASDPAAVRTALADDGQLVPGSQPTTFQQTGDMGIGALERDARTRNPDDFQQRTADQNTARQDALPNPGADIGDLGAALRARFDAADAETEANVNAAAARAGRAGEGLGDAPPEEHGAAIRTAMADAEKAGRARTSAMYAELGLDDPAVTANVGATRGAAGDILSGQAATARPPEGEEAAIFNAAAGMKPVAPIRDLLELRSRVGAELRRQRAPGGDPASVRRLSRLQSAIDGNLDTSIADAVEAEQAAAAAGEVQAGDSLASRIASTANEFGQQQTEARAVGGGSVSAPSGVGATANLGSDGAAVPSDHGPGGIARNPSVPGEQPTVSPDVIPGIRAANAAYKAERQTFGADPVDNVLAQDKAGGYAVLNGEVPKAVFRPGPGGFERVQNAIKAGGDRALQAIEDYAAASLRRAAVKDGAIDAKAHAAWMAKHQDAMRALPEATRARLSEVGEAQRALDEASVNRANTLKAANANKLANDLRLKDVADVPSIVGALFNRADSGTQLKALLTQIKGDPQALAGLRQAIADHIARSFIGNTEAATSGVNLIKADAFQTFVRKNSGALKLVFNPEEMSNLHAIAADLNRAKRTENALKLTASPGTAQDLAPTIKGAVGRAAGRTMLDMVGAALGEGVGSHMGMGGIGAAGGVAFSEAVQAIRAQGIARVDQLVTRALLDPSFARALLAKIPEHRVSTTAAETGWVMRSKAIQRALSASAAASATQDNPQ